MKLDYTLARKHSKWRTFLKVSLCSLCCTPSCDLIIHHLKSCHLPELGDENMNSLRSLEKIEKKNNRKRIEIVKATKKKMRNAYIFFTAPFSSISFFQKYLTENKNSNQELIQSHFFLSGFIDNNNWLKIMVRINKIWYSNISQPLLNFHGKVSWKYSVSSHNWVHQWTSLNTFSLCI